MVQDLNNILHLAHTKERKNYYYYCSSVHSLLWPFCDCGIEIEIKTPMGSLAKATKWLIERDWSRLKLGWEISMGSHNDGNNNTKQSEGASENFNHQNLDKQSAILSISKGAA